MQLQYLLYCILMAGKLSNSCHLMLPSFYNLLASILVVPLCSMFLIILGACVMH